MNTKAIAKTSFLVIALIIMYAFIFVLEAARRVQ